jgi:hypothetical protein
MAVRWAVLGDNGQVVNVIMIDDPMPPEYDPGYGTWLVPPAGATYTTSGVPVLNKTPSQLPQIGDVMNINTGAVFRYVPQQIVQLDPEGNPVTVSSAPQVVLKKAGTPA